MSSSRFTRPLLLLLFIALLSTVPLTARAEIVHGFLTAGAHFTPGCCITPGQAFDFDTQTIVRWDSAGADLTFAPRNIFANFPLLFSSLGDARITGRLDVSLENLLVAPESGYQTCCPTVELGVWVIKTNGGDHGESVFAKFRVHQISFLSVTIEYYVQLDHSRNLDPLVPVEQSTWGRIKALYQ